jgi:hypothetical protein
MWTLFDIKNGIRRHLVFAPEASIPAVDLRNNKLRTSNNGATGTEKLEILQNRRRRREQI